MKSRALVLSAVIQQRKVTMDNDLEDDDGSDQRLGHNLLWTDSCSVNLHVAYERQRKDGEHIKRGTVSL